ncbi:MAG: hypothetical protein WCV84_03520 [Patescibacteria group bacterium]
MSARLIEGSLGEGLETLVQLARHGRFTKALGDAIRATRGVDRALDALHREFFPQSGSNILLVPDLSAVALTAFAEKRLRLTRLDRGYKDWDYYRGQDGTEILGRGRWFEPLIWTPGRSVGSEEVRGYFRDKGFHGDAGAFTAWRLTCGLNGWHASVPDDNGCWRHPGGYLCAPYSSFDGGDRGLYQGRVGGLWHVLFSFVGFREVLL